MKRRLTAILTSCALALGLIAPAPAAALDNEELRRLLAGAVILGIVGLAVRERQEREEARHDDDRRDDDHHDNRHGGRHGDRDDDRYGGRHGFGHWDGRGHGYGDRDDHGRAHGRDIRALPGSCLVAYHTRTGGLQLFDRACLAQRYDGVRQLPSACAVTIQRSGRYETGFDPRCLSSRGYQVAGH